MKLAIADPPYLGRARRWYGDGRGHGSGRGKADFHEQAHLWDKAAMHHDLLAHLEADYDGWVIAASERSLPVYVPLLSRDMRVGVWVKTNGIPSGSRIRSTWEPVIYRVPDELKTYRSGMSVDDTLICGVTRSEFVGQKPEQWTHWVLSMLGYLPERDSVVDIFPGSGAVTKAIDTYRPAPQASQKEQLAPAHHRQRLRSDARGRKDQKAAVLAALRAGGSIRTVAREAKLSTHTVQRWKKEANTHDYIN